MMLYQRYYFSTSTISYKQIAILENEVSLNNSWIFPRHIISYFLGLNAGFFRITPRAITSCIFDPIIVHFFTMDAEVNEMRTVVSACENIAATFCEEYNIGTFGRKQQQSS